MKERNQKRVVVGSDFFQETTKVTLMTLKLALEPLLFFVLEFLQNNRLNNSYFCGIYFGITTTTLDSGTLTFLQRDTPQWIGNNHWNSNSQLPQLCNNSCSCPWPFHRLSEWQKKNFLTSAGTQSKWWHLLANNQNKRVKKKRRQYNGCFGEEYR